METDVRRIEKRIQNLLPGRPRIKNADLSVIRERALSARTIRGISVWQGQKEDELFIGTNLAIFEVEATREWGWRAEIGPGGTVEKNIEESNTGIDVL